MSEENKGVTVTCNMQIDAGEFTEENGIKEYTATYMRVEFTTTSQYVADLIYKAVTAYRPPPHEVKP